MLSSLQLDRKTVCCFQMPTLFKSLKIGSQRALGWLAVLVLMAGLPAGCGGSRAQFYPLDNPSVNAAGLPVARAYSPAEITVYVTRKPVEDYRELGILYYSASDPYFSQNRAIAAFREKAAEVGASGVILIPSERWHEYDYPDWLPDRFQQTRNFRQSVHAYRAVAVIRESELE